MVFCFLFAVSIDCEYNVWSKMSDLQCHAVSSLRNTSNSAFYSICPNGGCLSGPLHSWGSHMSCSLWGVFGEYNKGNKLKCNLY